ncbi:MAG TPA: multidrug effflux MFS transporter [Neisseria sp.]|jgi:DHA1 family bicyclomycin/chloramphenicol resistance-like MFS transporter|uniref:Bcr/CflA family efflux transporter n=1 Tax=Uruburuella suis TaxID=252130 RepID=A0AAE9KI24_9NEIS|nr:multidrug effflux MFS transporter [Uruburuella suis]TCP10429.1 DHA1 family bicyclomycin/chloramphenicol resistance-like MFS transporter [Uruburuella suis]UOO78798.1 multidrug effflux MFS transporter [Uruburuella suis]HRM21347.1 multidrug effflux MFS transporter [Neisseria sp.]
MTQAPQTLSDKQMAALLAMLVAIMPFSVDAYLPAIPAMADSLGADIHRIEQSLSTFMFGVAAGQLVGGSIADIKGRRVVALTGLVVYIASVIGLVFIRSADELLLLRMVQAFGAGMTVVVVGAIVRDNYEGNKAAQMFALIGIIMMGAPLVAPMLGAALKALGGWRLIFGFLALYAAIVWGLLYRFLAKPVHTDAINRSIFRTVAARYRHVLSTRPALGFLFFQAFSFSSMFVFLTESSFVYMNLYGLSAHAYAWVFGLNIITMATFNRITAWKLKTGSDAKDILKWGILIQLAANALMVAAVMLTGMPPLWWLVGCVMVSVGTQGLIVANTQACFMGYFKEEGGSANAVLGVCQSLIGAAVGMLTTWLHNGTPQVMAGMMLAATVCGMVLLLAFSRDAWRERPQHV